MGRERHQTDVGHQDDDRDLSLGMYSFLLRDTGHVTPQALTLPWGQRRAFPHAECSFLPFLARFF